MVELSERMINVSNSKINIALIFGGRSAEHEVSILSARSIYDAFDKSRYNIFPIAISEKGRWLNTEKSTSVLNSEMEKVPKSNSNIISEDIINFLQNKIDLAFPVLHGPFGEDGKLQGFFDILDINYIGCNLSSSAVGMDKAIMKKLFAFHNIPQTKFLTLSKFEYKSAKKRDLYLKIKSSLGNTFFVKPANMGSSIGINKVETLDGFGEALQAAFKHDSKIIFEKAVDAREIEAAVLGFDDQIQVSVPGEIVSTHNFYDYKAKYKDETTNLVIPADIPSEVEKQIRDLSAEVFNIVGASGLSRIDFFITKNDNRLLVNEINTMPGFTRFSMYPLLFKESGIAYSDLLDKLVNIAQHKEEKDG
jgi:D-alanine-D-alanine ligase